MVTRTVREDWLNGNPNREGGSYSTRSIAHKYHKKSTITPLLPR